MRRDTRPLVEGCNCHACQNHHRAYIHHLLIAHEMLADVLLHVHNTHHMLDFFGEVRACIAEGDAGGSGGGALGELKRRL